MFSPKASKICRLEHYKENIPPENILVDETSKDARLFEKATPKKRRTNQEDPLTPNSNIKLLTSLAAQCAYVNCSTPKSRKSNQTNDVFENSSLQILDLSERKIPRPRKEKSLSIVCQKFLNMYPLFPTSKENTHLSLDEACSKLGVERRRLYDIVNVFESILMLEKLAKNRYIWFGKTKLMYALEKIKELGIQENIRDKLEFVLEAEKSSDSKQCIVNAVKLFNDSAENKDFLYSSQLPEFRKEKSLALMSQKFLMLFLVSSTKIISLSTAAKVLNGFQNNGGGAQIKTQIRRLYDIANVLSSVGLIEKETHVGQHGRKPVFRYVGPEVVENLEISDGNKPHLSLIQPTVQGNKNASRSLIRHSSFQEICAVAEIEHQKLSHSEAHNSAPPFDRHMLNVNDTPNKTNFSNLALNLKLPENERNCKESVVSMEAVNSSVGPTQPCMKLLNVPVQLFAVNGAYYIFNPVDNKVSKVATVPSEPVFLMNPSTSNKVQGIQRPLKNENIIIQISKPSSTQGINSIIKNPAPTHLNSVLKTKEDKGPRNISVIAESTDSGMGSTRTNSPCSFYSMWSDSPVSSGYTTPVPGDQNPLNLKSALHTQADDKDPSSNKYQPQPDSSPKKPVSAIKNNSLSLGKLQNNLIVNSLSSESQNSEVAEILQSKSLGQSASKVKPFLFDEKTILSPIKKNENGVPKVLTPSPFMTPPYAVPKSIFDFNASNSNKM